MFTMRLPLPSMPRALRNTTTCHANSGKPMLPDTSPTMTRRRWPRNCTSAGEAQAWGVARYSSLPVPVTPPKAPSASPAFLRSPEPKSPDRHRSIERRRRLAASGPMPPALACRYTVGELAVLRIVADEVIARGTCDRSLAEIAARAGVCRKLAQLTLRMAARDGLIVVERRPRPGRKNLTNVVRIISQAWLAWMRHRNHRPSGDRVHGGQGENLYLPRAQVLGRGLAKGAQSGHGRPATAAVPRYRPRKCPSGA
jgi:hypothetical protein